MTTNKFLELKSLVLHLTSQLMYSMRI